MLIDRAELRACMARDGVRFADLANYLRISHTTLTKRLRGGAFTEYEIVALFKKFNSTKLFTIPVSE